MKLDLHAFLGLLIYCCIESNFGLETEKSTLKNMNILFIFLESNEIWQGYSSRFHTQLFAKYTLIIHVDHIRYITLINSIKILYFHT